MGEVGDLFLDAGVVELVRRVAVDRRADRRGRHRVLVVGVAAGVQDLQADATALSVDRVGDDPMTLGLGRVVEHPFSIEAGALAVREEATGDHQPDAATGPLGVERRHARVAIDQFFQTGVHRAHQDAVRQFDEAEVERTEEVRIGVHGHPRGRESN